MSNYGPPGGQYPGQPSDPWQQNDPYGQPSGAPYPTSPYGAPDPWNTPSTPGPVTPGPYGQPPSGYDQTYQQQPPAYGAQPGYPQPQTQPGYPPPPDQYGGAPAPVWGPPAPPPKKRGPGGIIAVIVVLVVLLCGGGVTALYLIGRNSGTPVAQHSTQPSAPATVASPTPADSPTPDTTDPTTIDPITTVKVGQCVINKGSNSNADLQIVTCTKNTFKVLARFNGTTDKNKCNSVPQFTHYFTYTTTPTTDDFLLCLKKQ